MYIKIDSKILIFLIWFYITNQLQNYILLMIFVFFHELVHMIVAIFVRIKPLYMEIKPIGCSIAFQYTMDDYNKKILKGSMVDLKKIIVYIAGPLFNFCVAFLCCIFRQRYANLAIIMYMNILIGVFNLICIYPLDGGRILKCILHIFLGEKNSYVIIKKISNIFFIGFLVVCSFLILIVHNIGIILGVIYLWYIKTNADKIISLKLRTINLIESIY